MGQTSTAAPTDFPAWARAQRRWLQFGTVFSCLLIAGCLLTSDPLYCDDITPCSPEQSCLRPEQQCVAIVPFSAVVSDLTQRCGGGTASCHATGSTSRLTVGANQTRDGLQATLTQLLSVPGDRSYDASFLADLAETAAAASDHGELATAERAFFCRRKRHDLSALAAVDSPRR